MIFQREITGAGTHSFNGDLFADCAGNQDKRHIGIGGMYQAQGRQPIEMRQAVIRDHQLPSSLRQRPAQRHFTLHPPDIRREAPLVQSGLQQQGIETA